MKTAAAVLVLVLVASAAQDDAVVKKVRDLTEQLRSDDVQVADDAMLELVKLGEKALPAIRTEIAKATGDTKLKLEAAAGEIEKGARRARAMGTPVVVSLKAEGKPTSAVLAELATLSCQPIVFQELPEKKLSVSLAGTPFWDALDAVCKEHGGIMWRVKGAEVRVEKAPYRAMPRAVKGNVVIFLDGMTSTTYLQQGGGSSLLLDGGLAWTKGARPLSAVLTLESFEDDKGTNLLTDNDSAYIGEDGWEEQTEAAAARLSERLQINDTSTPHEDAEHIAVLKGSVAVKYALNWKKALTLANPLEAKGQSHKAGESTVSLQEIAVSGRKVTMTVGLTMKGDAEQFAVRPRDFVIVDKEGKSHAAVGRIENWEQSAGAEGESTTVTFNLTVTLPEKAEMAAFEFIQAEEVEEISIPFEFKNIPIK
jgi:hypothetical protein